MLSSKEKLFLADEIKDLLQKGVIKELQHDPIKGLDEEMQKYPSLYEKGNKEYKESDRCLENSF